MPTPDRGINDTFEDKTATRPESFAAGQKLSYDGQDFGRSRDVQIPQAVYAPAQGLATAQYPLGLQWIYENRDSLPADEIRYLTERAFVHEGHKNKAYYPKAASAVEIALREDAQEQTSKSFINSVIRIAEGTNDSGNFLASLLQAEKNREQATGDPLQQAAVSRRVALLSVAFAENKLDEGVQPYGGPHTVKIGKDMDVGDYARPALLAAIDHTQKMLEFAARNEDKAANGVSIDETMIRQIRTVRDYITDRLDSVSGVHKIQGPNCAFEQATQAVERNEAGMRDLATVLEQRAEQTADDPPKKAKLFRDAALCYLAFAGHYAANPQQSDISRAKAMLGRGEVLLSAAQKADTSSGQGDTRQLRTIAAELSRKFK
ncbi:MAG: hypothetical protein K2W82_17825 [Candidatus Obscuribacterales bacterium]|nr:hypothetical protein [Candidatus Obscuribacterales bacterium]